MPRQARLDGPGLLHHLMGRAIERRPLFKVPGDYADFLDRIESVNERHPQQILAWALMPNHFHLLVRSGAQGVAPFMKRLMTGYAVGFNHRHRRVGHLFQNRYKSIVCEDQPYLLELVRYIHLNPYRAGLVNGLSGLARYPYTGHGALVGTRKCVWQDRGAVLGLFSKQVPSALRNYITFMRDGLDQGARPDLMGGGLIRSQGGIRAVMEAGRSGHRDQYDSRILGSGDFVATVLKTAEKAEEVEFDLKRQGIGIQEIAKKVAAEAGVTGKSLFQKGRAEAVSRAKSKLIYMGVEYLGRSNREMALLTRMSDPSASNARKRAATFMKDFDIQSWLKTNLLNASP